MGIQVGKEMMAWIYCMHPCFVLVVFVGLSAGSQQLVPMHVKATGCAKSGWMSGPALQQRQHSQYDHKQSGQLNNISGMTCAGALLQPSALLLGR